jgi:uncharacterized protein (DUF1499 family)
MNEKAKRPWGTRWCGVGSTLCGLALVLVAAGLLGARIGILSPITSFLVYGIGLLLILVAIVTLAIGLAISFGSAGALSAGRAWGALLAGVLVLVPNMTGFPGGKPPIHDITTNVDDPPEFGALVAIRAADNAANPPEYAGEEAAKLQQEAFPDLTTLQLAADPAQVFLSAGEVMRDMGWEVVAEDAAAGRLEATDTSEWFRFKDDVVVRIKASNGGTSVDVRSKSRVGQGDMGANEARISEFLERLRTKTG